MWRINYLKQEVFGSYKNGDNRQRFYCFLYIFTQIQTKQICWLHDLNHGTIGFMNNCYTHTTYPPIRYGTQKCVHRETGVFSCFRHTISQTPPLSKIIVTHTNHHSTRYGPHKCLHGETGFVSRICNTTRQTPFWAEDKNSVALP